MRTMNVPIKNSLLCSDDHHHIKIRSSCNRRFEFKTTVTLCKKWECNRLIIAEKTFTLSNECWLDDFKLASTYTLILLFFFITDCIVKDNDWYIHSLPTQDACTDVQRQLLSPTYFTKVTYFNFYTKTKSQKFGAIQVRCTTLGSYRVQIIKCKQLNYKLMSNKYSVVFTDYIHKVSMSRRKLGGDRQFDNVDYTQLTETDNGFVDSQVRRNVLNVYNNNT